MSAYLAEFVGTALLILFGGGVVAASLLAKSKGHNAGWLAITIGWGLAVMLAVYAVGPISGAHLNPAISIALAAIGKFDWALVPGYITAQVLGAFVGAELVWLAYLPHWKVTDDQGAKLGIFCTSPAIRHTPSNLLCEMIGTAALVFGALAVPSNANFTAPGWSTGFGPVLVGLLVVAIGLSLGGPTGYAINPARDFGPRLAHALLPIAGKGGSDWSYAWIPIVGPICGGLAGAFLYKFLYLA